METMKPAEHNTSHESGRSQAANPNQNPTREENEVIRKIADNYLRTIPPKTRADHDSFLKYMKEMRLIITGHGIGSLLIKVKCDSLEILERLWEDYSSGHLGYVVQWCFVSEEILTELSLAELKLKTTISKQEYEACKMHFGKDPAQGNSFRFV